MNGAILIIDDDPEMCDLLKTDLSRRGFSVQTFQDGAAALDYFKRNETDVVLTDLNLPGMDGIELCNHITSNRPDVPVIVFTAFGSMDTAIAAIRAGAYDFVTKPIDMDVLSISLKRALRNRELQQKVIVLSRALEESQEFEEIIGESPVMNKLFSQIDRIADTEASVLITGESGTGKELVARALHRRSRRTKKPFIAVNCSALPENLLESELFGHVKGAFTDARTDKKGLIFEAEGGTLFLDEVGDIPLTLQPKLLRALESRSARPVGGRSEISFDVRILAATNHDLETAVEDGRFREDLYYRLNVIQLSIPPLRLRGNDILIIAARFVKQFASRTGKEVTEVSTPAAQKLLDYSWPGNVRELRNCIERAVALTRYDHIVVDDLPEKVRDFRGSRAIIDSDNPADLLPLEEIEKRYILHVMDMVGSNRSQASRILGLDRKTLYRKLLQYEGDSEGN
jgi:DNA-binding NtrC family response regulator